MSAVASVLQGPRRVLGLLLRTTTGNVGLVLLVVAVLFAACGGFFAPYDPTATVGIPGQAPGGGYVMGLDFIGRDVWSRVLYGGRSTLLFAVLATVVTYVVGGAIGLIAGFTRSVIDPLLMRSVDILLSIPALLVMLLLVTALDNSSPVLVLATSLVLLPGVARIVRSATLEVSTRGYIEAAVARGEPSHSVLLREIAPNIGGVVAADLGLRFSWAIILIASVNFLGIGIQPPKPDWGVMASENRVALATNPMAVVGPCLALALLIVAVNLVSDAYIRQLDRSSETQ
jgi:peptide/nickel transport system permease protein